MKAYSKVLWIGFGLALFISGCKESIFGPNSGDISGKVSDHFNRPIQSASLSTIVLDSNRNATFTTSDENGEFQLLEVALGTIQVSAQLRGYKEDVRSVHIDQDNNKGSINFNLVGAPEIISVTLNADSASRSMSDTLTMSISTMDVYNSPNSTYDLDVSGIVKDDKGTVVKIYDLESQNAQQNQLFSFNILANDFVVGTYTIDFVAYDEDNIDSQMKSASFRIVN